MAVNVFDSTYPDKYSLKYPLIPEEVGPFIPGRSYRINDVVRCLGSVFKSKIDGNTDTPATWDKETGDVYFCTESWEILVNGTAYYILHNEIKEKQEQFKV